MPRILAAVILAAAALMLTVPTVAGAHRPYSSGQAQQQVYNAFNTHCGNGFAWVCQNRQLQLGAAPVGDHSWAVYYSWMEVYVPTANPRWCSVYVRVDGHVGGIMQYYEGETCHG